MIKSHTFHENGRQQFSAVDMLDQALGLPTPEGYAVITKEFARFLQGELGRLYAIEDSGSSVDDALEYALLGRLSSLIATNIESFREFMPEGQPFHVLDIAYIVAKRFVEGSTDEQPAPAAITKSSRGINNEP